MNKSKFSIGEIVTSKKSGLPMVGLVVGMMVAIAFRVNGKYQGSNFKYWYELDPEWDDKWVYYVLFKDGPQRTMSYEEWCDGTEIEHHNRETYERRIPPQVMATYPEADLESYENETTESGTGKPDFLDGSA